MKMIAKAALTASTLALVAVTAPVTAAPATYSQSVGALECDGHVHDGVDGGTLYAKVAGQEVRLSNRHFRTVKIVTRLNAQEKTYDGTWKTVEIGAPAYGKLARAVDMGAYNVSKFSWGGNTNPELAIDVEGEDDLFRAKVVTRLIDDEGVLIAKLVNYAAGQCRV